MRMTRLTLGLVLLAALGACMAPEASTSRSDSPRDLLEREMMRSIQVSL